MRWWRLVPPIDRPTQARAGSLDFMRAWILNDTNGPDSYRLAEIDTPEPGPGEVRVELRASALNHLDLWVSS